MGIPERRIDAQIIGDTLLIYAPVPLHRRGDALLLELFNTGKLGPTKRDGIGVSTTLSRLDQMYGERVNFELVEQEGGVMVRVAIPWSTAP